MFKRPLHRDFGHRMLDIGGGASALGAIPRVSDAQAQANRGPGSGALGQLFMAKSCRRRGASGWDRTRRNADYVGIQPGKTATMADSKGAGCIRRIGVTVLSPETPLQPPGEHYLRKRLPRAYVHADDYASIAYWYQTVPHKPLPPLPPVADRLPAFDDGSRRKFWSTF